MMWVNLGGQLFPSSYAKKQLILVIPLEELFCGIICRNRSVASVIACQNFSEVCMSVFRLLSVRVSSVSGNVLTVARCGYVRLREQRYDCK